MKTLLLLIYTLLGVLTMLFAQSQLTVRVRDLKTNDSVWVSVPDFGYNEPNGKVLLPATGKNTFGTTLTISQSRLVYVNFRSQWLTVYVEPAKDLAILFLGDSLTKTLHFEGSLAGENTALNQFGYTTYNTAPSPWTGPPTTPDAIVIQLLADKRKQLDQFSRLKQTTSFSPAFYDLLEGNIRYKPVLELANSLIFGIGNASYADGSKALKRVYDKEPFSEDRFLISDVYFSIVNRTDMALAARCDGDTTCEKEEIKRIFNVESLEQFRKLYNQYGQLYAEINRAPYLLTGKTLEKTMAGWIYGFKGDYLYLRLAYDQFTKRFPASVYRSLLEKELQPFFAFEKQPLAPGDINYTPDPQLISGLDDLLKRHRGRAVYVDFWGTWCAPCREEMPYSSRLKEKFKGQLIDFLYVAQENGNEAARVDKWKTTISQLRITGEHFMMTPTFEAGMKKQQLKLTQFPTYALFDKMGKLVKFDAARPSETEAVERQIREAMK